jgi:hypothetical protein
LRSVRVRRCCQTATVLGEGPYLDQAVRYRERVLAGARRASPSPRCGLGGRGYGCQVSRDRKRVREATVVAAAFSGAPSTLHALLTGGDVRPAIDLIGRKFSAIGALPLVPGLADNVAFGALFALVADRA